MAESYQDIMSRLNGGQQAPQPPKAATDFATYVRTLLANPNPQGGMMGDAAAYYADPFRKQNAINQAILDEELRKKKEAEDAAAAAGGGVPSGMFNGSSGGDSEGMGLTQSQIDYLDAETPMERALRIQNDLGWIGNVVSPLGASLFGRAPVFSGQTNYNTRSPEAIRQEIEQQKTLSEAIVATENAKREAARQAAAIAQQAADAQATADRIAEAQRTAVYSAPLYNSGGDGSSTSSVTDTYTGATETYGDTSYGTLF